MCISVYFSSLSINSPSFALLLLPFLRYFLSINCKKFLTPTIFHHFSDPHQGSALDLLVGSQCPSRPPAELRHLWHLKKSLAFQLNSILLLKTVAVFFPEINPVQANWYQLKIRVTVKNIKKYKFLKKYPKIRSC